MSSDISEIIDAYPKEVVSRELSKINFVRPTNNSGNEIYIFNASESEILMNEVGRLREISFRDGGGGTGKSMDIDEYDLGDKSYNQLIVWDPIEQNIIGGYRYILCRDARDKEGYYHLSTEEIFNYSQLMKFDYLPYTIELGRSWVQPAYQPRPGNRSGLFSLDNLWDGLGALVVIYKEDIQYFAGKMTMYNTYNREARDYILSFLHEFFPDNEKLVSINEPFIIPTDCSAFISEIRELNFKEAHAKLNQKVRELGENIPPMFNSYMNLSPTMKTFPTCVNDHFGGVEETGIIIKIDDIYETKTSRHVKSYMEHLESKE